MKTHSYRWLWMLLLLCWLPACRTPAPLTENQADVIVVSATPGGVASAVAAARQGARVILLEPTAHVGGIVSSGLTNSDIHKRPAVGGLFYEFTRRIVKYYQTHSGTNSPDVKLCQDGYWMEPHVAEQIYLDMLQGEGERIRLLYRHRLKKTMVRDGRIVAIVMEDLNQGGREVVFAGKMFIDATYEGDLAAQAGVPYRVARESRQEYGEKHAGKWYAPFGTDKVQPGSTGAGDDGIQAFCFRFSVTTNEANRIPIRKPAQYDRTDYRWLLEDIKSGRITRLKQAVQFYPMPGGKFETNSDHPHPDTGVPSESCDLAEENWSWPEASYAKRERIYQRYLSHNVGLLWFLQHDEEVPEAIRLEAQLYGWCKDEFADNQNVPWQVYVRQGRRILGEYLFTEHDGALDASLQRTRVQTSSIAIAEFPFDSHAVHKFDPKHPGVREGYFYSAHDPIQIPYGVLVPRKSSNLLVPVACSASHVGYNSLRMEPLFMALGQASGIAAQMALQQNCAPKDISVAKLQPELVRRGAVITYYGDLPFDHPNFAALQYLGARGLNPAYKATPELKLTRQAAAVKLTRILQAEGRSWTPPTDRLKEPLRLPELLEWCQQAGLRLKKTNRPEGDTPPLTLERFAVVVYESIISNDTLR